MKKGNVSRSITILVIAGFISFFACGTGGGGVDPEPQARLAFVTSTSGTGDLSTWTDAGGLEGLDAADTVCQSRANEAALSGTFVAWMSDSTDDAYCRAHGLSGTKAANCEQIELPTTAGPWIKIDGTPFAAQLDIALDDGVVFTPANMDEFGSPITTRVHYYTGNDTGGVLSNNNTCTDWSTTAGQGNTGRTDATTDKWNSGSSSTCNGNWRLLCLETGNNNTMPAYGNSGKVVFLSSASGNGRLGSWVLAGGWSSVAAGDAVCRSLASSAGIDRASSFKAWLSDSSAGAVDHITSDGPWVRVDGIKVADNMSSLVNTGPLTAISVTEEGDYLSVGVFTGTLEAGTAAADVCSDWTSNSSGITGENGYSSLILTDWTELGSFFCNNINMHVYCFED